MLTLAPPKPLLLFNTTRGRISTVSRRMFKSPNAGSSCAMWADQGINPSRIANAQNPVSIAPASDRPCPVNAFVELMAGCAP